MLALHPRTAARAIEQLLTDNWLTDLGNDWYEISRARVPGYTPRDTRTRARNNNPLYISIKNPTALYHYCLQERDSEEELCQTCGGNGWVDISSPEARCLTVERCKDCA
jgi:hypothetical protein